jgi:hypothetical protein
MIGGPVDVYRPAARLRRSIRWLEEATRPVAPEIEAAHTQRWQALPPSARTDAQLLGRKFTGCEATHGVFPACDFGCQPCYHADNANRVPVDGRHTVAEVERQMAYLLRRRGPGQYAQLIGGEVSLLPAEDHAAALEVMRRHGRIPMSFSHGDFDEDYLEAVALHADGTPRWSTLAFAVHVDTTMRGRRAVPRPRREAELHAERARIAHLFRRLQRRHGIRVYLAHNMTVTPHNLADVAEVVRVCRSLGYRMCSFQPAAYLGDERRWQDGFRDLDDDRVWAEVERGVGRRLPVRALQIGDERCNRSTWGMWFGSRYVPVFDDLDRRDLEARDAYFRAVPANLRPDPWPIKILRTARSLRAHPRHGLTLARWAGRFVRRGIARRGGEHDARPGRWLLPVTYVLHRFMDGDEVRQAWELLEQGIVAEDAAVRAAQERLQACSYGMAHPDRDRVVPACVQHSLLDRHENQQLLQLLPRRRA